MTRTPSATKPARSGAARTAVFHARGGSMAILEIGGFTGSTLEVLAARTVSPEQGARELQRFVAESIPLVGLVPLGQTVCRTAEIPGGSSGEMLSAAAILAEVQLPESVPAHRRGAGALRSTTNGPAAVATMCGWVSDSAGEAAAAGKTASWCVIPAALAGLSVRPIVYADPADGTIAAITERAGSPSVRVLREDPSDAIGWRELLEKLGGESTGVDRVTSAGAAGATPWLGMPEGAIADLRSRIRGVSIDADWLARYGLLCGAALVASGADELLAPMARLKATAPQRVQPPYERGLAWLTLPRNAITAVAASLALMVAVPLGVAWLRVKVLDSKAAGLQQQKSKRSELDRRSALYRQLELTRLPMTKLLASVAAATPEQIVATSVRLSPDQGLGVQGIASSPEQVDQFQQNLNKTKLFSDVKITRRDAKSDGGIEFDISADQVVNAHLAFAPIDDFAARTLAARLGVDESAMTADAGDPALRSERPARRNGRTSGTPSADADGTRAASERPAAASTEPPSEISQAEIDKLDHSTAMKSWVLRRSFISKNPKLDPSLKARLESEIDRLKARQDKALAEKTKGAGK